MTPQRGPTGATARDETNLERLAAEVVGVVDDTMRPEFVGLWLKPVEYTKSEEAA